jgi:hypothetical protein
MRDSASTINPASATEPSVSAARVAGRDRRRRSMGVTVRPSMRRGGVEAVDADRDLF